VHLTTECSFDEMGEKLDKMLPDVLIYCMKEKFARAGSLFTLYHKYDEKNKRVEFSSCYPVKERVKTSGDFALAFLESGRYYKTTFQGDYKYSDEAWKKAFAFASKEGVKIAANGKPFEVYTAGHTKSLNPADWITEIYLPVE
jgi:effector-binding domain-containing protein